MHGFMLRGVHAGNSQASTRGDERNSSSLLIKKGKGKSNEK